MSAQDRTLDQYQEWMNINAVSHLMRTVRSVGILERLRQGQMTAEQLCESLSLRPEPAGLLLDAVVAIGVVEKYGDDYALSQAARLFCQYDDDLGDARWERLAGLATGTVERDADDQAFFDHAAATQWIHTPAAMQAAEILDVGGEGEKTGLNILDLGCGSAVWSCAMAHRDADAKLTLVDQAGELAAANSTAQSIGVQDRVSTVEGDPCEVELPTAKFDIVLLAERLHALDDETSGRLLARAVDAALPGGRVVVIDQFRGPTRPDVVESVEALKLVLDTSAGRIRTLEESQLQMEQKGLTDIQFTFLAASRVHLGLAVGVKS